MMQILSSALQRLCTIAQHLSLFPYLFSLRYPGVKKIVAAKHHYDITLLKVSVCLTVIIETLSAFKGIKTQIRN